MDEYTVEIEELQENIVVLAIPMLRLLLFGSTLEEAMDRARSAIDGRLVENGNGRGSLLNVVPQPASVGPSGSTVA